MSVFGSSRESFAAFHLHSVAFVVRFNQASLDVSVVSNSLAACTKTQNNKTRSTKRPKRKDGNKNHQKKKKETKRNEGNGQKQNKKKRVSERQNCLAFRTFNCMAV